jgi:hypothetical protein
MKKNHSSSSGFFGFQTPFGELRQNQVAEITLDLDVAILHSAAGSASLLQFAGQGFHSRFITVDSGYHGYGLSSAPLGLAPDPDNSIPRRLLPYFFAAALGGCLSAAGADAPLFR